MGSREERCSVQLAVLFRHNGDKQPGWIIAAAVCHKGGQQKTSISHFWAGNSIGLEQEATCWLRL